MSVERLNAAIEKTYGDKKMYIIFDHYKKSEADFEARRHAHMPHQKSAILTNAENPNGATLEKLVAPHIEEGDINANMQYFTGTLPNGYVVLN